MAKLTEAQQRNRDIIREAGGVVLYCGGRQNYTFTKPGSDVPIRGMNMTAVKSLVRLKMLVETADRFVGTPRDHLTFRIL